MKLEIENYHQQAMNWPKKGKYIMARYTEDFVVVYQAYRPEIGLYATEHQCFGGAFSYSRMSWIKTNFLWMMYRCGWASKEGQEVVLAIYLKRDYFDRILGGAWPSINCLELEQSEWKKGLQQSNVRLQWDPDHDPFGQRETRRAIQLGLRGEMLAPFRGDGLLGIENITDFVKAQKQLLDKGLIDQLQTPAESVYPVSNAVRLHLCMSSGADC